MKNLKKFEGKAVKNSNAVKGGSKGNDFKDCVRDYCLTGKKDDTFVHEYQQNESATTKL